MDRITLKKIETFFKQKFNNKKIKIEGRANKDDSAEVLIEDEFIGVVFEDNEDGDTCFQFNMTILSEDLEDWIIYQELLENLYLSLLKCLNQY